MFLNIVLPPVDAGGEYFMRSTPMQREQKRSVLHEIRYLVDESDEFVLLYLEFHLSKISLSEILISQN